MNEATPTSLSNIAQVAIWLLVVVLVILASAWLLRRFGGGMLGASHSIRVVSATSLGGRDRLALIDVGGQQLLLGVSPGRINTLHVFDEPVVDPAHSPQSPMGRSHPFARYLQQRMSDNDSTGTRKS